ncbi:MAG: hypothetical protein ACRC6X_05795 [Culicoidibacterales bacterium]
MSYSMAHTVYFKLIFPDITKYNYLLTKKMKKNKESKARINRRIEYLVIIYQYQLVINNLKPEFSSIWLSENSFYIPHITDYCSVSEPNPHYYHNMWYHDNYKKYEKWKIKTDEYLLEYYTLDFPELEQEAKEKIEIMLASIRKGNKQKGFKYKKKYSKKNRYLERVSVCDSLFVAMIAALLNILFWFTAAVLFYAYLIFSVAFFFGGDKFEAIAMLLLFTMLGIVSTIIMFLLFLLIMKPATNETKFEKAYLDGSYQNK